MLPGNHRMKIMWIGNVNKTKWNKVFPKLQWSDLNSALTKVFFLVNLGPFDFIRLHCPSMFRDILIPMATVPLNTSLYVQMLFHKSSHLVATQGELLNSLQFSVSFNYVVMHSQKRNKAYSHWQIFPSYCLYSILIQAWV